MKLFAFHVFCLHVSLIDQRYIVFPADWTSTRMCAAVTPGHSTHSSIYFTFTCKKNLSHHQLVSILVHFGAPFSLPLHLHFTLHCRYFFSLSLIRLSPCFMYLLFLPSSIFLNYKITQVL